MTEKFYKDLINSIYETKGIFLKSGSKKFSYKQLRESLEVFLWKFNHIERQPIVTVADKSLEMYAAIFAIILTNNIWVPLSPKMGTKRLNNIIDRLKPKYIITDHTSGLNFENLKVALLSDEIVLNKKILNTKKIRANTLNKVYIPNDTAMIYFTSGSTGQPKGVLISHQSYIANVKDMLRLIDYGKTKVFSDIHDTSFVISIPVIFPCVIQGGTISIPNNQVEAFFPLDLFKRHEVSCLITVPSLIDRISQSKNFKTLKIDCLIVCGEPCHISTMKFIKESLKPKKVYNFYGSTEVAPWIFYLEINDLNIFKRNLSYIPIGKPINEDQISIAEDGELFVTGPKVTKGYFEEVDKDKFFVKNNKVWFKTGDILKKDNKWYICLGRKDSQIKISGHRIDLMEIEGNIQLIEDVDAAVCIVKENQAGKFIASVVITKKAKSSIFISNFLKERIPNYMIPKEYHFLIDKPINKNGKLDRSLIKKEFKAIN